MTKEIQLESLTINRHQWGELQGQLYGTIAFGSKLGKTELPLDEQTSKDVVDVCSEALERIAKQTANIMVTDMNR